MKTNGMGYQYRALSHLIEEVMQGDCRVIDARKLEMYFNARKVLLKRHLNHGSVTQNQLVAEN